MTETKPASVNFTVEPFSNERDMEFQLVQTDKRFNVFQPQFKAAGLKKVTSARIWNREGKAMVGWVFEYENAEACKACQPIRKEIEQEINVDDGTPFIKQAFRGIILNKITL